MYIVEACWRLMYSALSFTFVLALLTPSLLRPHDRMRVDSTVPLPNILKLIDWFTLNRDYKQRTSQPAQLRVNILRVASPTDFLLDSAATKSRRQRSHRSKGELIQPIQRYAKETLKLPTPLLLSSKTQSTSLLHRIEMFVRLCTASTGGKRKAQLTTSREPGRTMK